MRRWVAAAVATLLVAYVTLSPLFAAKYPPITDLPFHAAAAAILRRYFDGRYHFREQFQVVLLKAPYWTHHALGALFALVMPIGAAIKLATALLVALLPAGLATLFWGMKKHPLLGLLGLGFAWSALTHLGFINFVGAIGLCCMALGLTMRLVDAPTRGRTIALGVVLTLVLLTHVFRFPFTVAAVAGATALLYPATRRWREPLLATAPSLALFLAWVVTRDRTATGLGAARYEGVQWSRLKEIPGHMFAELRTSDEMAAARGAALLLLVLFGMCVVGFFVERRHRAVDRFARGSTLAVLAVALAFLGLYLTLPMNLSTWWFVYPRESVAACVVALALCPDLPRGPAFPAIAFAAIAFATVRQTRVVTGAYRAFDGDTADFQRIVQQIPAAPKLAYLVFDHEGGPRVTSPWVHLPAWVQAEKGGWLMFHFASWNQWPVQYRSGSDAVPPPTPFRFEWMPERFQVLKHGPFFDTFLIRSPYSRASRLAWDPSIKFVAREGNWWLYRRER